MTVADYILDYLVSLGIDNVFLLTGGAIAFVIDAFHGRKDIRYTCVAHEQAAAMAADAYARLEPGIAATMVTSGPGATNLITGIACSWFDSVPVIHISGQVNTYEQKRQSKVRQVGFQETDIVSVVKPITKFAEQLDKPENIRYLLEKATAIAKSGRPGPVLVDIPQNFQRAEINPKTLHGYHTQETLPNEDIAAVKITRAIDLLKRATRPVLLLGGGVRIANAANEALGLAKQLGFPVVTSWSGVDCVPYNFPLRVGEIGVYGNRAANFAVQNADVILSIGSRLDTRQTGGKPQTFARGAKKIVVDIDRAELDKRRGLTPDLAIPADAKQFMEALSKRLKKESLPSIESWQAQCTSWQQTYQTVKKEYYTEKDAVNPYVFITELSRALDPTAVVISDTGGHLTWTMQAFQIKQGQRLFSAFGNSPMGYALPAAIGASLARGKATIVSINGDGSLQINIQELQTIVHYKLPIKIFVFDNNGYGIIKQFQGLYLGSRTEATGKGYSHPDFVAVGKAYGLKSVVIANHTHLRQKLNFIMATNGPVLCTVRLLNDQKIIPKLEFGKPIEELSPQLPRKEFLANMYIDPIPNTEPK